MLHNTEFNTPLSKWDYSSNGVSALTNGTITLHSEDYNTDISITQSLPITKHHKLLRLSANTKTDKVSRGQKHWMSARIIIVPIKQDGTSIYSTPHNLVNLYGDHNWSQSSGVFKIPETASKISVSIQLVNVTGTFQVRNISLVAVSEKSSFRIMCTILGGLWLITILYTALFLIRLSYLNKCYRLTLALGLIIAIAALLPVDTKNNIEQLIFPSAILSYQTQTNVFSFQLSSTHYTINMYKIGHFILFFLLSSIAFHCKLGQMSHHQILCNLLIFALVTEVLQLFVIGRNPELRDLLIDLSGIILSMLLFLTTQTTLTHTNKNQD